MGRETKTPRVVDTNQQVVLEDANKIAEEWVTPMRLEHVLQKIDATKIEHTGDVIKAMTEDVIREAGTEIVISKAAFKAIGNATAKLFKKKISVIHER